MIGKVLQNNNFRETTRYILGKERARLLGGSVMGQETDTISREFLMSRDLNPEIKRPVYHLIDSYSYADSETEGLTDEFQKDRAIEHFAGLAVSAREPELLRREDKTEYRRKVNDFIEAELYEYQWFCAAHEDTKHKHTHLVASRISLVDGRCIPTWQDKERSHRICREIEQTHGLQQLQSYYEIERRSLTRGQKEHWEKTGKPPVMIQMQEAIDKELVPGRTFDDVAAVLQENHGITATVRLRGKIQGIVYEKVDSRGDLVRMSGSQLGRGYTYAALGRRLERELEITPPEVQPQSEAKTEPDPLEAVMQEQERYAERLSPLFTEIWAREKSSRAKLKMAIFEQYQIQPSEDGHLELYRGGRLLLGHSGGGYYSYGLTEQDCSAMERFNEISSRQAQERQQQQELAQRQQAHMHHEQSQPEL